jgi:hypothetical protein
MFHYTCIWKYFVLVCDYDFIWHVNDVILAEKRSWQIKVPSHLSAVYVLRELVVSNVPKKDKVS